MPRILIDCPQTGAPVATGQRMTEAQLEATEVRYSFRCMHCNEVHQWVRADARVEQGQGYMTLRR